VAEGGEGLSTMSLATTSARDLQYLTTTSPRDLLNLLLGTC